MRIAIFGSMPGERSLAKQQYYAHPRNSFWLLMEHLFAVPAQLAYAQRCAALCACGVGLWDVLASCTRHGSLDASIDAASAKANDLAGWLAGHPLHTLGCNGALAAKMFARYCQQPLHAAGLLAGVHIVQLPSSSPAHAAVSFAAKLNAWRGLTNRQTPHPAK